VRQGSAVVVGPAFVPLGLHLDHDREGLCRGHHRGDFYSKPEDRHCKGFDLWNEFRVGYTIDFHIAAQAFVVDLQYILGFGLYRGNKPADFGSGESPLFRAPLILVGAKF
jgi:hypothetical protein